MIISQTYFVGELLIPGGTGNSPAHESCADDLDWFLTRYEKLFLSTLLGDSFAATFLENNGSSFSELKGFIYRVETLESPVAAYVYYFYWRNKATETTQMGEVRPISENAELHSGADKLANAWNMMVDLSREIWDHLIENEADYPLFDETREFPFEKINTFNI